MKQQPLKIKYLGTKSYQSVWADMKRFTDSRDGNTYDEIWLLEHDPVFSQGLAGKPEHILNAKDIPVIQSDRGGQVTYHGPGQLVAYCLIDIRRKQINIKTLVKSLEQCVMDTLSYYGINATRKHKAPGVYVKHAKIASLGIRIRKHCSYHGLALNVDMDLSPFAQINPCGFEKLIMTQIKHYSPKITLASVEKRLIKEFCNVFAYKPLDIS